MKQKSVIKSVLLSFVGLFLIFFIAKLLKGDNPSLEIIMYAALLACAVSVVLYYQTQKKP